MITMSSWSCFSHIVRKPVIIFIYAFTHFLILLSFSSLNSIISYAIQVSYSDHCSLILADSAPKMNTNPSFPLGRFHTGYGGGSYIFDQTSSSFSKSFVFRTRNAYNTEAEGVLKVEAEFLFPLPYTYTYEGNFTSGQMQHSHFSSVKPGMGRTLVRLLLEGFWSEYSGKLCMVGSSRTNNGDDLALINAVLKLENVNNSGSVTSLIKGTLECLSSGDESYCFEPISVLMLPQKKYVYTLVSKEFDGGNLDEGNVLKNLLFSSTPGLSFCNEGWWPPRGFKLRYAPACQSEKNCNPFGGSAEDLPHVIFLSGFECSDKESRNRVLVEFYKSNSNGFYQPFNPNRAWVGEGHWDEKKLSVIACRFLDVESLASARIADCSMRLSVSFSATLSVEETTNIVGEIWSNKTVNDPGYFNRIMFRSSENRIVGVPGMKYEYTATDRVRKSCRKTKPVRNNRDRYPNGNSIHMRFDMSVRSSEGKIAKGYAIPFSIDDQFYEKHLDEASLSSSRPANSAVNAKFSSTVNMSYKIGFKFPPGVNISEGASLLPRSSIFDEVEISAEGIYNERSGGLCMAGCRILNYNDIDSLDCEILLKFQFPPLGELKNEGNIKGSFESLRKKSDPLYFKPLETFSSDYVIIQESTWTMDMEIAWALISSTFAILFVRMQHLHTKRHPEVLPLISLVMVMILTLGYLMPPLVHIGSLFLQNDDQQHFPGKGGSLEASEVLVDLVKIVVFFFHFRLLQLIWTERLSDGRHKGLWVVEKTTLLASVPLCVAGAFVDLLVNWNEWLDLKCYAGVILDGFLLPQILLNTFRNSKENALAGSFYIGNTFLQVLPHICNLYEAYTYVLRFSLWEIIIVVGGLIFAAVIFLQQRHGANVIPSQRSRVGRV